MKFGQLVSNENQQARFNTFSTLKMICTGCYMKGAILLLLNIEQQKKVSRKNEFFI